MNNLALVVYMPGLHDPLAAAGPSARNLFAQAFVRFDRPPDKDADHEVLGITEPAADPTQLLAYGGTGGGSGVPRLARSITTTKDSGSSHSISSPRS